MTTGGLVIEQLGKAYRHYPSSRQRLAEWLLPWRGTQHRLRWVLRDIDLVVPPGQALGIVGRNGAGKSTLLKLIAGTSRPTTGRISPHGRVAALLELGMGFHPQFTGRQNVHLAGRLAGMGAAEIDALLPAIEAFADIGDAIDAPLRTYSTGMQARLGFSLATARRPDILIVDEALSVGDSAFQHKCFERMRQLRQDGTTLLLVSHSGQSIMSICDRAVLLDRGQLVRDAAPEVVLDLYNALLAEGDRERVRQVEIPGHGVTTSSGTGEAVIEDVSLTDARGARLAVADVGAPAVLCVTARATADLPNLVIGFLIKDRFGQPIYGTNTDLRSLPVGALRKGERVLLHAAIELRLGPGSYSVAVALHGAQTHLAQNYHWRDRCLLFKVENRTRAGFTGSSWLEPRLAVQRLEINQ
jgi:lipopolysaccharide transport system ATP-binding protein